jgi:ABC-type polysaccharide/polyol phosphate transport system ATPase subunit
MGVHAIELERLGKRYRLGEDFARYRYRTLRDSLSIRRSGRRRDARSDEIWALRDLSLSIDTGEVVGVIGLNGAGKTTLLKILARITEPTTGVARMRGRVGALLEVGTGFHPELTGRENVYLNGNILGMSRREISRRFDEIVEFAGLTGFLDTPLKRYSSGMILRLAFAVAAHVQPPILAVDEVLAVGDAEFREKCLGAMSELGERGRTVVFVSHDLGAIAQLCSRTIWLKRGSVAADGPTPKVLSEYVQSHMAQTLRKQLTPTGRGPVELVSVEVADEQGARLEMVTRDKPFSFRVSFDVRERLAQLDLAIYLVNSRGITAISESYSETGDLCLAGEPGRYEATLTVPAVLASDDYTLGVWMGAGNANYVHRDVFAFRLWPAADDPGDWFQRARVAQPGVRWTVAPERVASHVQNRA